MIGLFEWLERTMGSTAASGSCFCGAVAFQVGLPTVACLHCHCSMCRRNHGAGYVTWVAAGAPGFKVTAGEDQLTVYQSSAHGTRSFCSICGTSLFCINEQHPEIVDIPLANFDEPIDRPPEAHYYLADRVDWVPLDESLPDAGP
jgi:hypothetical protein